MKKTNNIRGYMLAILGGVGYGEYPVSAANISFMKYEIGADWLTTVRMLLSRKLSSLCWHYGKNISGSLRSGKSQKM